MSDLQPVQNPGSSTKQDEPVRAKRQHDPFSQAMGGLVLILLGVIFFIVQSGLFGVTWSNMWGAFLIGLGVLLILQGLLRFVFPDHRRGAVGAIVGGFILIAIGAIPFGGAAWSQWWPLGLIALGAVMLLQQFLRW